MRRRGLVAGRASSVGASSERQSFARTISVGKAVIFWGAGRGGEVGRDEV